MFNDNSNKRKGKFAKTMAGAAILAMAFTLDMPL